MEIKLKDVNDDLTITRGGVSIEVFRILQSLLPPVEGDVQIFDNPECTEYATGTKQPLDIVYARINNMSHFTVGRYDSENFTITCDDHTGYTVVWANSYFIKYMSEQDWQYIQSKGDGFILEIPNDYYGPVDVTNYNKIINLQ